MNFSKVQDKCLSITKQIDCIAQYLEWPVNKLVMLFDNDGI